MTQELWTRVDDYLDAHLTGPDPILDAARQAAADAGLPDIAVAPNQGKFLYLLARIHGAKNILELGTLAGYSTLWLARALPPEGRLITLELDPRHAEVAQSNLARAGFSGRVDVRIGRAIDTLPSLKSEAPFDFIFIDADKASTPDYFNWSLQLSRPGTVIVVDNVIRDGAVIDAKSHDPSVQGIRRLNQMLKTEPRVTATTLQTVGGKGYDGFTLALVNE
jgi:predicted O-methyltransferase YrrM